MDGFDENSPFVLLATNLPTSLDSAIIREGRIDIKIEIKRPDINDAKEIFDIHLKKVKLKDAAVYLAENGTKYLYSKIPNTSGAMIANIVNESARIALYRAIEGKGAKGVTIEDVKDAIDKVFQSQIL
jgi:cell division protease FtsH